MICKQGKAWFISWGRQCQLHIQILKNHLHRSVSVTFLRHVRFFHELAGPISVPCEPERGTSTALCGLGPVLLQRLTLSQEFQPMAAQLSMKTALPLTKILATASCRSSKTAPWFRNPEPNWPSAWWKNGWLAKASEDWVKKPDVMILNDAEQCKYLWNVTSHLKKENRELLALRVSKRLANS